MNPKIAYSSPLVPSKATKTQQSSSVDNITLTNQPSLKTARLSSCQPQRQQELAGIASLQHQPGALAPAIHQVYQQDFVQGYVTPTQVLDRSQELAQKYPDLVQLVVSNHKTHGYDGSHKELQGPAPLFHLKITAPQAQSQTTDKVGVFQYAAPHAREWINPMIMLEMAEQLLANYQPGSKDPQQRQVVDLLQNLNIYIAPQTNPDGANFSMHDQAMWRKNRRNNQDGTFGVDINRNYPYDWQSNPNTSREIYPGPSPASEPETQHILEIVQKNPDIHYVVDWHSYSEEIRRPKGVQPQDSLRYDDLHQRMHNAIAQVRGRDYAMVTSQVANGTSDDHFYHTNGIISTVMETGRAFQPSEQEAVAVKNECVPAALELLKYAWEQAQASNSKTPLSAF